MWVFQGLDYSGGLVSFLVVVTPLNFFLVVYSPVSAVLHPGCLLPTFITTIDFVEILPFRDFLAT